jgi:hypothetical protein
MFAHAAARHAIFHFGHKRGEHVLMMQPSQYRNGNNGARSLNQSMQGRIFL